MKINFSKKTTERKSPSCFEVLKKIVAYLSNLNFNWEYLNLCTFCTSYHCTGRVRLENIYFFSKKVGLLVSLFKNCIILFPWHTKRIFSINRNDPECNYWVVWSSIFLKWQLQIPPEYGWPYQVRDCYKQVSSLPCLTGTCNYWERSWFVWRGCVTFSPKYSCS